MNCTFAHRIKICIRNTQLDSMGRRCGEDSRMKLNGRQLGKLMKEKTEAKKMRMYLKLSSEEHLDDRKKELLGKLERELFEN